MSFGGSSAKFVDLLAVEVLLFFACYRFPSFYPVTSVKEDDKGYLISIDKGLTYIIAVASFLQTHLLFHLLLP